MDQQSEKTLFEATLVFLIKEQRVLLARKTRHIGGGCWNGYGGGPEPNETLPFSAVRELKEESGVIVNPRQLEKVAEMTFHNTKSDGSKFSCLVHVYFARSWKNEARESEEMITPRWFPFHQLPTNEMMPADAVWVPIILSGKRIVGEAWYGPKQKELLSEVLIREVEGFN